MFEIITHKKEIQNIKILLPYNIENKTYFDIFVKDRDPFLIQTPFCIIPYKYSLYDDKYFSIELLTDSKDFKEMIHFIVDTMIKKISYKFKDLLLNKTINYGIFSKESEYKFRLRNPNIDSIFVFDDQHNTIDIRNIEKNDRIQTIFQIEKLLIDNTSISLVSRLLQIQKKCSRLDPYNNTIPLFVSESTTKDYSKYDKMLKLGIPLMGVKQKMTLDGLDDTDIELFMKNKIPSKGSIPLPPPPPPPPSFSKLSKNEIPLVFLNDIKNGNFNLKKAPPIVSKKEKVLKFVDTSRKVPSLEEILMAKNRLKKINQ